MEEGRPKPDFAPQSAFSQRKRTPFRAPRPPKAPAKSCPPVSRVSRPSAESSRKAQPVSFKSDRVPCVLDSPHYDSGSSQSYFEQCFQVCEKLGEGSFGEVYRVRSRDDGKMYAIKKSCRPFRGEFDRRQKLAEVEKHERLPQHPNCVQFYKAWEERHLLYIQTELCRMSLSEYADLHGKVPEQRIWHMLIDLVKGLKHLHDHQLCHLDIKPANIFLGNDEFTCKMGDFGLCSNVEQGFVDAMEGDAKYLAPELMCHQFGKPADIFSLGISLLELACDVELPSGGETWHCLRKGCIPPHLMKDLSPSLVHLLSRMMHPEPDLRPTVDEILADPAMLLYSYQHSCYKASYWLFSAFKHIVGRVLTVFMLLFSILPMRKAGGIMDSNKGSSLPLHNDSFSEDEDGLLQCSASDDIHEPNAKFNRSWIKNSPVKYPNLYYGPPIPIDFDSECDTSCSDKMSSSPKELSPALPHAHRSISSHQRTNGIAPHNRLFAAEPKKLMEAFTD